MSKALDVLAQEVAEDQAAIQGQTEDTRTRVIRMGKRLRVMQKEQKKEQSETGQSWKEWVETQKLARPTFPEHSQGMRYMLIARYPKAYVSGMSIKEAYRMAGQWKKNGGDPPIKLKTTIKARPLITIGAMAGKLDRKIEELTEMEVTEIASEQAWTDDEIIGATEILTLLRQSCNLLLRKLKELSEPQTA